MARGQAISNNLAVAQERAAARGAHVAELPPVSTPGNPHALRARTQYTLFTEDPRGSRLDLVQLINAWFGDIGATVEFGQGVWQGESEPSARIVLVLPNGYDGAVLSFASALRREFNQDAVLVTVAPVMSRLVTE